ncbi:hypothetical protein [Marinimicrobium sp. ABcell2]|uniref:hypothetical protein n=1 Tax=Marinimicrobium sp. ABcell2 TaxID=3069751 RepID=UPI0027B64A54|nr:hypothetical protein [Marinimicrobium sp. ABcell2]MDQ2076255.1 hypothetical protein [Marinimicrobium sp. ABcell2]
MKCILVLLVVVICGCAAQGDLYKDVQTQALDGKSSIVIFRKKQFTDGGSCYTVRVNGEPVGVLGNGGFLEVLLDPGKHVISIPHLDGKTLSSEAILEEGEVYYVEYNSALRGVSAIPIGAAVMTNVSFNFALSPVPEPYALEQLEGLKDSSKKVSCMATLK